MNPRHLEIDPFQLELMKSCFDTIADDMALTLMRTAHSGIVRDSLDFSTALLDAEGLTVAQGICTPMHMGSFYDAMRKLIVQYDGRIDPGDVFIFNDPYAAEGQHLPDIYITTPIFTPDGRSSNGRLVAWATTVAYHSDVGGIVAGSNALGAEEIFQEGLRLPVVKFMARGEPNQALWDVIALNVRTPEKVMGDLQAQLAACRSGEREMRELFERYGVDTVLDYGAHLQDYAQRLTRAEIAEFPDGVYEFTDHIEGLGENPELVVVKTTVTVAGEDVSIDFTGTSDQIRGGINPTFPFTKASCYAALRSVMVSDIPNCHGFTVPITVTAPKGSLVNPLFPSPCGARGITGYRIIDCLFGALAQALPDRVTADTAGGSTLPTIAGYENGRAFVFCETFMGTWGATSGHDGQQGVPPAGADDGGREVEARRRVPPRDVGRGRLRRPARARPGPRAARRDRGEGDPRARRARVRGGARGIRGSRRVGSRHPGHRAPSRADANHRRRLSAAGREIRGAGWRGLTSRPPPRLRSVRASLRCEVEPPVRVSGFARRPHRAAHRLTFTSAASPARRGRARARRRWRARRACLRGRASGRA